ncbi:MAG: serpin family protein [Akkermansia sp.]|nr:serpin family protein [Akkermansia sp.]
MLKITGLLAALAITTTALADTIGLSIFRHLAGEKQGNIVFSPAGVENLLRSLRSYSAGETEKLLSSVSLAGQDTRSAMQLQQADAIFAADNITLNPGFHGVHTVNFRQPDRAAAVINNWCSEQTHGKIPTIVKPSDIAGNTAFVAANAIYLNEKWLYPFSPSATHQGQFIMRSGQRTQAQMMSAEHRFRMAKGDDWQAVALPYNTDGHQGSPGYFIGILPAPGQDARAFAAGLTQQKFNTIRTALAEAPQRKVRVILPRFTISTPPMELRPALEKLGLASLFKQADFGRLVAKSPGALYLGRVLQKCYVQVDEQGTEAAVVTAAVTRFKSLPRSIVFNRPFIWFITEADGNNAPWFAGIFEQP